MKLNLSVFVISIHLTSYSDNYLEVFRNSLMKQSAKVNIKFHKMLELYKSPKFPFKWDLKKTTPVLAGGL